MAEQLRVAGKINENKLHMYLSKEGALSLKLLFSDLKKYLAFQKNNSFEMPGCFFHKLLLVRLYLYIYTS